MFALHSFFKPLWSTLSIRLSLIRNGLVSALYRVGYASKRTDKDIEHSGDIGAGTELIKYLIVSRIQSHH